MDLEDSWRAFENPIYDAGCRFTELAYCWRHGRNIECSLVKAVI